MSEKKETKENLKRLAIKVAVVVAVLVALGMFRILISKMSGWSG
jgi:hypothetical protein